MRTRGKKGCRVDDTDTINGAIPHALPGSRLSNSKILLKEKCSFGAHVTYLLRTVNQLPRPPAELRMS